MFEVCRALEKAPHFPAFEKCLSFAGAPTSPAFTGELQVDLLFLGDAIALNATDVYSQYSPLLQVRPANPSGVRDDFRGSRIADFCAEWNFKLQFQGMGTRPRPLERLVGQAREMFNRLAAGDPFPFRSISGAAQFRLNAMLSHGGFPAYHMVSGSSAVSFCMAA